MEAGDCGCTGRRNTREMWVLTLTWLTACLCCKPASFLFRVLTSHSSHGEDPRPPCPGPIAELRKCNTSSLVKPPEEKGFHCHFTHQTCSLRKARFEPVVDRGVRDGFRSKMRAAIQDWPHLAPHKAPREGFQEDSIGGKKEVGVGWGRCQKSEAKNLRHNSKRGCGVARRPGAAAGSGLSTWHRPPSLWPFLGLVPQGPASPLLAL